MVGRPQVNRGHRPTAEAAVGRPEAISRRTSPEALGGTSLSSQAPPLQTGPRLQPGPAPPDRSLPPRQVSPLQTGPTPPPTGPSPPAKPCASSQVPPLQPSPAPQLGPALLLAHRAFLPGGPSCSGEETPPRFFIVFTEKLVSAKREKLKWEQTFSAPTPTPSLWESLSSS